MTGGGGNTAMYASWMDANFWFSAPAMAPADRPLRSSKSLSGKNTSAALDCAAKPLADTPANCTELATPGCCLAISPMRFTTSAVRSSDAAGGNCTTPTRYSLSCCGMKPAGVRMKPNTVSAMSPA